MLSTTIPAIDLSSRVLSVDVGEGESIVFNFTISSWAELKEELFSQVPKFNDRKLLILFALFYIARRCDTPQLFLQLLRAAEGRELSLDIRVDGVPISEIR